MVRIIKTHNILNGYILSIVEFVIIAGVVTPFAISYAVHGRLPMVVVSFGIILNCFTVVALAVRQMMDKEPEIGLRRFRDQAERTRIAREYPGLPRQTTILTVTALLPYVLATWTASELITHSQD